MKIRLLSGVFLLVYSLTYAGPEEDIRATFENYRLALLAEDGEKAWDVIDFQTRKIYEKYADQSLTLSQTELNSVDFISKITVLRLRLELKKKQLQEMNGEELFIYAIQKGMISKASAQRIKLEKITMNGNEAQAYLATAPSIPVFFFVNESGSWKLALSKSFNLANEAMAKVIEASGMSEQEYIEFLLKGVSSNREVDKRIFEGPLE